MNAAGVTHRATWQMLMFCVCLAALAAAAGPSVAADAPTKKAAAAKNKNAAKPARGKITGTVTAADGKPLAGVVMEIVMSRTHGAPKGYAWSDDMEKWVHTDAAGHFALEDLDPKFDLDVQALTPGYRVKEIERIDPSDGKPRNFTLSPWNWKTPEKPELTVWGVILDPEGKPVANAKVEEAGADVEHSAMLARPLIDKVAVTDGEGRFLLVSGEKLKNIHLKVGTEKFGMHYLRSVPFGTENHLQLPRGSAITGRVVRDGKPIAGIKLTAVEVDRRADTFVQPTSATTDAEGRFVMASLRPEKEMTVCGLMESCRELGALPALYFTTADFGTLDLGDLPIERGYRVAGRIVLDGGKPVRKGIQVHLSREEAWDTAHTETDAEGRFVFTGVPAEIVTLGVRFKKIALSMKNKSYELNREDLQGRVTGDIDNLVVLYERGAKAPEWRSAEGAALEARHHRVVDETLAGVTEKLETPPADAKFVMRPELPPRNHGWSNPEPKIARLPRQPAPPPATAQPAKTITGTVTDGKGNPVADAELCLPVDWRGARASLFATARSDAEGHYELSVPEAWIDSDNDDDGERASWYVMAWAPGHSLSGAVVELPLAGKPADIKMGPPTKSSLVVKLPDGSPAVGAKVTAPAAEKTAAMWRTEPAGLIEKMTATADAEGRARLPAIDRRSLDQAAVSLPGFGQQFFDNQYRGGLVNQTVKLRAVGRIEGRIATDQLHLVRGLRMTFTTTQGWGPDDEITSHGIATVVVDDEGRFVIPEIATGNLHVEIPWDLKLPIRPLTPNWIANELLAGETLQLEIPLVACRHLHGLVRIQGSSEPVAGAKIWIGGRDDGGVTVTTDEGGLYSAYVLPRDLIAVRLFSSPMGLPPEVSERSFGRDEFQVPRGPVEYALPPLDLRPTVALKGTLQDAAGKPLAGMTLESDVVKNLRGPRVVTDEEGRFTLHVGPDGKADKVFVVFPGTMVNTEVTSREPLVLTYDGPLDGKFPELAGAAMAAEEEPAEAADAQPGEEDKASEPPQESTR